MSLVYIYDGSYEGLLSAVFEAYLHKQHPEQVTVEENLQITFDQQPHRVTTNETHARRVEAGITAKLGHPLHKRIWTAYLSGSPEKGTIIYRYLRRAFTVGRRVYNDLAHPDVLPLDKLCSLVGREAHLMTEFLRFSEMEGGVFYARISPENEVVPLLMPHFCDRYNVQPFLIHDDVHGVAGAYEGRGWYLVEVDDYTLPDISADELSFRRMWKSFYDTIAIRERYNPRCRRNMMPKKYWQNMTEMNFVETPQTARLDAKYARSLSRRGQSAILGRETQGRLPDGKATLPVGQG